MQVAAGQLGSPATPSVSDGSSKPTFQIAVSTKGRLVDEEDFANIIVRTGENGQITRLKDVARVELGSDNYALRAMLNNKTAVGVGIFQRPGSNAIAISDAVRAKMAELKKSFPDGIDYDPAYDPTVFVRGSIEAVLHTLLEAILLVVIVVIVFLQTWRASIIPLLAVPVSLIGTLGVMHLLGFGLNTLSLFGLVLAIGIVVDDAIVVVENVERNISEGLSPYEATVQAMKEVTGPIIATALVLCAVFLPTAFSRSVASAASTGRTTRRPTAPRASSMPRSAGSSVRSTASSRARRTATSARSAASSAAARSRSSSTPR